MACVLKDKVNAKLNTHLLKEDAELNSINNYGNFLDKIKDAADGYKLRPPRLALDPADEEEEKKSNEELNKLEDQYSDQIAQLFDIGFTDLKANIAALT